ncbi:MULTISPECIES: helix-hairpin-helix domain-containing protein [Marinobacter]|jgi:predicted flap endonuclease-1-like 5' DNA nuclease|uniref:Helix-hairpin-helix protein n=1 Tax=Marinobacter nauticus TaxID=2743 RepID=A0A368UVV9_MARNT|nr:MULTISPECIES: helix-hairpin-helix domain-containing protein [Marinobacter]RBP71784.1 helix-hairpin-helix protein [Marinobacter nauticus]RCW32803.1 helix-hairpin-helix protein [Marinobacter nauticus]
MAKKAKPSVDKIVKKVNKEFEKTSAQIEGLINDALKQFDNLQNQVQEPVRKLLKDMDELRDREMKRFNDEFERRMNEFHELQSALLERLGIASKETGKSVSKSGESTSKASGTKKAAPAKKTAAAKPAAKKTSTAKPKAAAPKKAAKPADKSDLTRVKGIGPATAKKMKEAGITSIEQIANPSDADKQKLEAFKSLKGFSELSAEAKKVL